jgi:prepilin-type N-terminal cleavage/methylation domain-containing protein
MSEVEKAVPENAQGGFSLVELLVAMTVTLIITGAVFGLLSGGQNAFRREPELSDRQQNIRMAMDLIMRDIATAGSAMPPFIQTFRTGLDGGTITVCQNNAGGAVPCPTAPSGAPVDEIEIMANPNGFDPEAACNTAGSSGNVRLHAGQTRVTANSIAMILMTNTTMVPANAPDGHWTMRNINAGVQPNSGQPGECNAGQHAMPSFNAGSGDTSGFNVAGGLCGGNYNGTQCGAAPGNACVMPDPANPNVPKNRPVQECMAVQVLMAEVIRYRIRPGADGVPNLERFSSATNSNFIAGGIQQFEILARGIDDLQVRYTNANNATTDDAPVVDQNQLDYGSVIHRVAVTLSSRSEARNVQGMTTAASGPTAIRGTLTSEGTPRAALVTLGTLPANRKPGSTGPAQWN